MKAWLSTGKIHIFLLCVLTSFCTMSAEDATIAALRAVSQSNLNFTTALYKVLAKKEGNLFFSPLSIEVILALTYMGAGGQTAKQMATGLRLPGDNQQVKDGFHALIKSLTGVEHITLDIANKIYTDAKVKLHSQFLATAQKSFLSDVQTVDFVNKTEDSRVTINQWVESKTNNKIKDLLAKGIVTPETVMVLVNAVYFKGDWELKFDPKNTKTEPFHISTTETKDVQMMHIKKKFGYTYSDELDAKVLEMPYKGNKLSLVVILPNEVDGLAKLEAKLPEVDLLDLLGQLGRPEVEVSLPKFKLEQMINLNDVLVELGMKDMFEDSADFSGLLEEGSPPVKVSKVVHKAFIEVNEEGSEAAAATAAVVRMKRSMPEHFEFTANRPFLFFLYDRQTRHVLFSGRLAHVAEAPPSVPLPSAPRDEL